MNIVAKAIRRFSNVLRFNASRAHLRDFVEAAARSTPNGAMVLDAGAGDCRYRTHFDHAHYEAADICKLPRDYQRITYACDLTDIPTASERFDVVVCTQVLEHVPEPLQVLRELNRVLKKNGKLYLTAPLYYPEHEVPYDFYRYTQFGFRHLLDQSGFEVQQLDWLEGSYMTIATQLWFATDALSIRGLRGMAILGAPAVIAAKLSFPVFAAIFGRMDMAQKVTDRGQCKNYCIVATKQPDGRS